jgi:response regulator RpfG family c-di-GMP phosphodiesterase
MKFLIVDDEPDILEILELLIISEYQVEFVKAANGQEAIDVIVGDAKFDLVISDFKMPQKTGADVYLALRANSSTPFLLLTADNTDFIKKIDSPIAVGYTEKPFDANQLFERIEFLLKSKKPIQQNLAYIPVPIRTLLKAQNPGVPLFLQLNESQYIKVINENGYFDESEFQRFSKKNLDSLFIETADYKEFIRSFNKNVFSQMAWNAANIEVCLESLNANWDLVVKGSQQFGWSESIIDSVKLNVAKTLAIIESEPKFSKVLKKLFAVEQKSHFISHSYWTLLMCTQIVRELKWDSKLTIQKLTFASLLHDVELSSTTFSIKFSLLREGKLDESVYEQAHYHLLNHPSRSAELIHGWSACPADVDAIIAQHHEKFDGSGYPQRLNFQTIFPLAAVFIIAEDMVYAKITGRADSIETYLESKRSDYNRGDLKPIFEAALISARTIDQSAA